MFFFRMVCFCWDWEENKAFWPCNTLPSPVSRSIVDSQDCFLSGKITESEIGEEFSLEPEKKTPKLKYSPPSHCNYVYIDRFIYIYLHIYIHVYIYIYKKKNIYTYPINVWYLLVPLTCSPCSDPLSSN